MLEEAVDIGTLCIYLASQWIYIASRCIYIGSLPNPELCSGLNHTFWLMSKLVLGAITHQRLTSLKSNTKPKLWHKIQSISLYWNARLTLYHRKLYVYNSLADLRQQFPHFNSFVILCVSDLSRRLLIVCGSEARCCGGALQWWWLEPCEVQSM